MNPDQEEFIEQISKCEKEITNFRLNIKNLQRNLFDEEGKLIEAKLERDRLKEKLRLLQSGRLASDL